jgi:hypothetical protein
MTTAMLAYVRFPFGRGIAMFPVDVAGEDRRLSRRVHERLFGYSGRVLRSDLATLLYTVAGFLELAGVLAALSPSWDIAIDVEGAALETVAQVISATIVAMFIAVLGLGFIVAQLVAPARGSRAVTRHHESRRLRAIVIVGLALLVASLLLSTASEAATWRLNAATALVIATVVYLFGATGAISALLRETIDPKRFSARVVTGARRCVKRRSRYPQFVSDDLFERLRIFRGWLRTVNRIGESRDLGCAIEGTEELVDVYIETLGTSSRLARVHETRPRATADGGSARWFADELGRALVRAAESGVSGDTQPRDLFRILDLFGSCIMKFAVLGNSSGECEARILLKRLVEVGLLARQASEESKRWFVTPALRLADLYSQVKKIRWLPANEGETSAHPSPPVVALAGWLVVTDAIYGDAIYGNDPPKSRKAEFDDYVTKSSTQLSGFAEHLENALELAGSEDLEPDWDIVLNDRTANLKKIAEELRGAT